MTSGAKADARIAATAQVRAALSDLLELQIEKVVRSKDARVAHHETSHAVVAHACGVNVGGVWLCRWKPQEPESLAVEPSVEDVPLENRDTLIRMSRAGRVRWWRGKYALNDRGWGDAAALHATRPSEEDRVVLALAGPIGEERFNGEDGLAHGWSFGSIDDAGSDYIKAAVGVATINERWLEHPLTLAACTSYLTGEGREVAEKCAERARALLMEHWGAVERIADELLDRQVVTSERLGQLFEAAP